MEAGARLCTAAELFEQAEGVGTGCGHDSRLIWSSSTELISGAYDLHCARFESVVVPGDPGAMRGNGLAPACVNVQSTGAALRCCADTACAGGGAAAGVPDVVALAQQLPQLSTLARAVIIPHHETFSTIIQPPYSSTKG